MCWKSIKNPPKKYVDVLVTCLHKDKTYVRVGFYCGNGVWGSSAHQKLNVIAWAVLPAPYAAYHENKEEK